MSAKRMGETGAQYRERLAREQGAGPEPDGPLTVDEASLPGGPATTEAPAPEKPTKKPKGRTKQ